MTYLSTGMMSGTSLDGMDMACCVFEERGGKWTHEILHAETIPYPEPWKDRLRNASRLSGYELFALHNDYGHYIGRTLLDFFHRNRIGDQGIVSSHGHTVFHRPSLGHTLQIGSGAAIAAETSRTVVCDFRSLDVALKGHGAPLVPIGDKLLFEQFHYCLNIGGFANISYDRDGERIAFDICPVNIVMNRLVREAGIIDQAEPGQVHHRAAAKRLEFDPGGQLARSGKPNPDLLKKMNSLPFYALPGPKSLGEEWVLDHVWPLLRKSKLPLNDKLRTYCEHAVMMISQAIRPKGNGTLLVTGGGAYNAFLMERLQALLSDRVKVYLPDARTIEFKEALIFAFLGVLRKLDRINCLGSVTGSRSDHVGGCIYAPF